jgi:hypothetical protein
MSYEYKIGPRGSEQLMRELESYLAQAELRGEGDLPIWVSF